MDTYLAILLSLLGGAKTPPSNVTLDLVEKEGVTTPYEWTKVV